MKEIKLIVILLVLVTGSYAQTDTTYNYIYECDGCGRFETISNVPIDLETDVAIITTTLPDAGTSTLATFNNVSARKAKSTKDAQKNNLFNVYPNPTSGVYFMNFESAEACNAEVTCYNIYGVELSRRNVPLKKGMNVIEEESKGLATGHYFVKAFFGDRLFVKKLTINKGKSNY